MNEGISDLDSLGWIVHLRALKALEALRNRDGQARWGLEGLRHRKGSA